MKEELIVFLVGLGIGGIVGLGIGGTYTENLMKKKLIQQGYAEYQKDFFGEEHFKMIEKRKISELPNFSRNIIITNLKFTNLTYSCCE